MKVPLILATAALATLGILVPLPAEGTYLNYQNMTVSLGPSMAAEPFQNRTTAASLASIIDATSPTATEIHTQSSHVWVTPEDLELVFDLQAEYDLSVLHFWNYYTETYDVDNIDFEFFDGDNLSVGTLLGVSPAMSSGDPVSAQDIPLAFPPGALHQRGAHWHEWSGRFPKHGLHRRTVGDSRTRKLHHRLLGSHGCADALAKAPVPIRNSMDG